MNKARQNITVMCPNCRTNVIVDLDKFLDYKRGLWRLILLKIESGYMKQKLIGSLAVCSAKDTLIKEMEEDGVLIATCLSCMTELLKKFHQSKTVNKVNWIPN
jgi:hypothetical protein